MSRRSKRESKWKRHDAGAFGNTTDDQNGKRTEQNQTNAEIATKTTKDTLESLRLYKNLAIRSERIGSRIRSRRDHNIDLSQADEVERTLKMIHRKLDNFGSFFNDTPSTGEKLPRFALGEVVLGEILGSGEQCNVHEIAGFRLGNDSGMLQYADELNSNEMLDGSLPPVEVSLPKEHNKNEQQLDFEELSIDEDDSCLERDLSDALVAGKEIGPIKENSLLDQELCTRESIVLNCLRRGSFAEYRFAIKVLKQTSETLVRREDIIDLSMECNFLASLQHTNIIKIRAIVGNEGHPKFGIVTDRLCSTLVEQLKYWSGEKKRFKGSLFRKGNEVELNQLWLDRLLVGFDISRALKYLHSKNIIYRDLKPENVGFDIRGNAKLFDFGLAKVINPKDRIEESPDLYKASGLTGSRRYMAPEVAMCRPYGFSADIYSFGIFLWELCSLETPFKGYDVEKHGKKVVRKNERPKLFSHWPVLMRDLIKTCWSASVETRPKIDWVCSVLCSEINAQDNNMMVSNRTSYLMKVSHSSRSEI